MHYERVRRPPAFGLVALACLAAACSGAHATVTPKSAAGGPTPVCGAPAEAPPAPYAHVVWIWFENHAAGDVLGSPAAPYLNRLARRCATALDYRAVSHPSLPNYIAATSGSTQGIRDDCEPSSCSTDADNLFHQLSASGRSWRAYAESMPSPCHRTTRGSYAARHNPPVYFTNLRDCARRDRPLPSRPRFESAFTFIAPNICNSMHDCPVSRGDAWLRGFLPKILRSPQYLQGTTVVVITFDEDDGSSGNRVPFLVLNPSVQAGLRFEGTFDHYSLLQATESWLGLPCLGRACRAPSLRPALGL